MFSSGMSTSSHVNVVDGAQGLQTPLACSLSIYICSLLKASIFHLCCSVISSHTLSLWLFSYIYIFTMCRGLSPGHCSRWSLLFSTYLLVVKVVWTYPSSFKLPSKNENEFQGVWFTFSVSTLSAVVFMLPVDYSAKNSSHAWSLLGANIG